MILWLNGTFGVGKTSASARLCAGQADWRQFGPEWVGCMLANNLADHEVTDFQQYPSWRRLVPVVADEIIKVTSQSLVVAQSVLVEAFWCELRTGLVALGHDVFHVVLDADANVLHARIEADLEEPEHSRAWRHSHVDVYGAAKHWLIKSADLVVDTATLDASATAGRIESALARR